MNIVLKKECSLILLGVLFLFVLMIPATAKENKAKLNPIDVTLSDSIDFHISSGTMNDRATITALNNQPEISSIYIDEIKVENSNDYKIVSSETDFSKQSINDKSYSIKLLDENIDLSKPYQKHMELKDYEYELSTGIHSTNSQVEVGQIIYTLKSEWKTYQINYELEGGILLSNAPKTYSSGISMSLPIPTKLGYEFIGWKDSQTSNTINEVPIGSYGDKTFVAQWKLIEFKISYDVQGGKLPIGYPRKYNSLEGLNQLPIPTKEGYKFKGWSNGTMNQQKIIPIINDSKGIIDESSGHYRISAIGQNYPRTLTFSFEFEYGGTMDFIIIESVGDGQSVLKEIRDENDNLIYTPTAYSNHYELPAGKYTLLVGYAGSPYIDNTTDIHNLSIMANQISYIDSIPIGSTEDKHFIANWEELPKYNISYDLNDGEFALKSTDFYSYYDYSNYYDEYTIHYGQCDLTDIVQLSTADLNQDFTIYIDDEPIEVQWSGGWNQDTFISIPEHLRKPCEIRIEYIGYDLITPGLYGYKYDFFSQYTPDKDWTLPVPTKEGYEFIGWKNIYTQEIIKVIPAGALQDIQLEAVWKPL